MKSLENTSYLIASVMVIHYEEALYQVYTPLPFAREDDPSQCVEPPPCYVDCLSASYNAAVSAF